MPSPPLHTSLLHATLAILLTVATGNAQTPESRLPSDHKDFGLPHPDATWAPYAEAEDHVCNRIFRLLYLSECIPTVVASALPREHANAEAFYVAGWYFKKRKGEARDRRLFGGDGRQLPAEGLPQADATRLQGWLQAVDGDVLRELRSRPRAAVWFQHDLLRYARRLLDVKQHPELLQPLLACAQRVALPRAMLQSDAVRTTTYEQVASQLPGFDPKRSIEVARESSRLFDAEYQQVWSTVHLVIPDLQAEAVAAWLTAGKQRTRLPTQSTALLLQGIVAIDDQGNPCATDLVIEVRTQRLRNRNPLAFDNPTTTRDGVDFAVWSLARRAIRDADASVHQVPFAAFRSIDMESQALFRDYGSRKHTTYAAQCTLCHRRSNTPDEAIAGFSALRTSSKPAPAQPGARKRLAEGEMLRFLDKLSGK
tara:strand:- start:5039 stop:6313 length:1275 start_codon:yes stop_codon:yes gene_type:complete